MKLRRVETSNIAPTAPFNFDATFHKPDHFTSGDNEWQQGVRWQTWYWQGKYLGLKFINKGTTNKPKIQVEIFSNSNLNKSYTDSLIEEIEYRFNL